MSAQHRREPHSYPAVVISSVRRTELITNRINNGQRDRATDRQMPRSTTRRNAAQRNARRRRQNARQIESSRRNNDKCDHKTTALPFFSFCFVFVMFVFFPNQACLGVLTVREEISQRHSGEPVTPHPGNCFPEYSNRIFVDFKI